ncbi:transporter substrate-binding domain-containing protein [Pseudomonas mediterranea]|uniref:Polar amino acid transport system substrate-binding protein n=1 Tax=Pseudomonas mediterranea TaxID=183795 RepID=A0AAX2D9C4_9PSED|nr:transporter substrate-binding domain-containing protein [Pseudomonas mediterranea]KGU83663.1 amino acid ABC transporter substrate-binding protein [Pseudomonas mediterranea CFBP 5447]MBL0842553.1 transporter substrate-binding domain-containing protein [Pseudomonas mediterranea]MDU9029050.1 transporter substrate-binding domain-containing protein [Pseudomonas mediterranea]QHA84932.1 transporter substrate-binding domain-containing protein [Pseudomonas mediterranea]UZE00666.1 transporter substra
MPVIAQLLTALLLLCLSLAARAEKLRIVTEPWAPYVFEENGKILGLDYETTAIVFKRLGIDVEWQLLPWKRCLAMLEQGLADGALDIFHSDERDSMLLYPSEPLSEVEFVMFHANARPHPFRTLADLSGLTVGTSPGYLYNQAFRESSLFKREAAPTHEANFGKLQLGRIDLLITDRRVGRHLLKQMQLGDQISENPTVVSRQSQYLALRRKAGMDLLVQRFSAELKRFKREPAYAELSARYGAAPVDGRLK